MSVTYKPPAQACTWALAGVAAASAYSFVLFVQRVVNNPPNMLGFVLHDYWAKFESTAYLGLCGLVLSAICIGIQLRRRTWRPEIAAFLIAFAGLSATSARVWLLQRALEEAPEELLPELAGMGLQMALAPFEWCFVLLIVYFFGVVVLSWFRRVRAVAVDATSGVNDARTNVDR